MIINKRNTIACGTEDYNKTYSLGYQVNHEDWSPYPRVNKLREFFLNRPYEIDIERFRLVTEAYQKHETAPRKLQCAHAFENILMNVTLHIYDEDLILG
ncbi:MAG: pyruvate formate lyase family protein, partial [Fusobacteriaceae bacterium]